jgi:hypothetical protein
MNLKSGQRIWASFLEFVMRRIITKIAYGVNITIFQDLLSGG